MENHTIRPKKGTSIAGIIRLIRPVNGGITFACIASMGLIAHVESAQITALFLAAAAGFFMTAFGNATNDFLDVEIDRINRPDRPLPSGQVTMGQALAVLIGSLVLSIGIGVVLGPEEFMFLAATAALLAGYNAALKRIPLAGNATVAVLTGAAFIFGGLAIHDIESALYPAAFAFLINLLRELVKDAVDVEGDHAQGVQTFPLLFGTSLTLKLSGIVASILVAATAVPVMTGAYSITYAVVVGVGVDAPLVVLIIRIRRNFSRKMLVRMSILLKYLMLVGLFAIIIGAH